MYKVIWITVAVFLAINLVVVAVWLWGFRTFLGGKAVFADLQSLELEHRHQQLKTPAIFGTFQNTGPVLVVATFDKRNPYAWIAATIPSCNGQLCMVGGDARLNINCQDAIDLGNKLKLAVLVSEKLRSGCHAP